VKIYHSVGSHFFGVIGSHLITDGDPQDPSEFDQQIDWAVERARTLGHEEALRMTYAHLLSKPDYDIDRFFVLGLWEDDTVLRQLLEHFYRRGWPDAPWPLKWEDYADVELVGAPGPTWAPRTHRWGPDAPPSVAEREKKR